MPNSHSKLQAGFLEKLFLQDERGGKNYVLFYQYLIRKYESNLGH